MVRGRGIPLDLQEERMKSDEPHAAYRRVECPECELSVKASRVSGRIYSHPLTGSTVVCRGSGRVGTAPDVISIEIVSLPVIAPEPTHRGIQPGEGPSSSVRTVSGGLPGHTKRR